MAGALQSFLPGPGGSQSLPALPASPDDYHQLGDGVLRSRTPHQGGQNTSRPAGKPSTMPENRFRAGSYRPHTRTFAATRRPVMAADRPQRSLPGPAGPAISAAGSAPSSPTRRCSPAPASSGPDTTPHPLMPARPGAGGRAAAGRRTEPPRDTLGRPLRSAICHGRPARISPVVSPAAFRRPQRRKGAPRNGERITPTPPDHSRLKVAARRSE